MEKFRCLPQKHDKHSPTSKTQTCKDLVCSAILALSSSSEKEMCQIEIISQNVNLLETLGMSQSAS